MSAAQQQQQQEQLQPHLHGGGEVQLMDLEDDTTNNNSAAAAGASLSGNNDQSSSDQRAAALSYDTTYESMKRHKDHPIRMKLLWDEYFQALAIKKAIAAKANTEESEHKLRSVNDFMCAQLALVCHDDVHDAIQRAQGMEEFKKYYGIQQQPNNSWYEEACRAIRRLIEICPGFLIGFAYNSDDGTYMNVQDFAPLDAIISDEGHVKDFVVGLYYLTIAGDADFASIHKGASKVIECKDMDWSKKKVLYMLQTVAGELFTYYPQTKYPKVYNVAPTYTIFARAVKQLLPAKYAAQFNIGVLRYDLGGLRSLFSEPNATIARQRLIQQLEESLLLRYQNEQNFSLQSRLDVAPIDEDALHAVSEARSILV